MPAHCIYLGSAADSLSEEIDLLAREHMNSAAALECRFSFADSMVYPLAVLLQSTAFAAGMPVIF